MVVWPYGYIFPILGDTLVIVLTLLRTLNVSRTIKPTLAILKSRLGTSLPALSREPVWTLTLSRPNRKTFHL